MDTPVGSVIFDLPEVCMLRLVLAIDLHLQRLPSVGGQEVEGYKEREVGLDGASSVPLTGTVLAIKDSGVLKSAVENRD